MQLNEIDQAYARWGQTSQPIAVYSNSLRVLKAELNDLVSGRPLGDTVFTNRLANKKSG